MEMKKRSSAPLTVPACRLSVALIIGVAAAVLWILLTVIRLDAQGPEYDELHQATAAFTHLGSPPFMFAPAHIGGYPLMNMAYSAAIKTNLYGLYLRVSPRFSVFSWRLCGILFVAAGIVLFCCLGRWALSPVALAAFLMLLLSDGNVVVLARHDWGPVALSLLARLAMLGLWLRGEVAERLSPRNSFALALITGLAIVEKLSAAVLVPALGVMLLASPRRRNLKHLLSAAAGGLAGILPLVLVNLYTFHEYRNVISLMAMGKAPQRSINGFVDYAYKFFALGTGHDAAALILGVRTWSREAVAETALLSVLLLFVLGLAMHERSSRLMKMAGAAILAYLAIWIGLYLLPRATWIHHWILGTPFQYAAVALAVSSSSRKMRAIFLAGVIVWVGWRLPGMAMIEKGILEGRASKRWDPSLSQIGMFAAKSAGRAVFVASDWGVGTQIYCFSNGRQPALLHEPFWRYQGPRELHEIQATSGTRALYLVRLEPPVLVKPENTKKIEHDLAADGSWREVPVEPEVAHLAAVNVRKFVYVR